MREEVLHVRTHDKIFGTTYTPIWKMKVICAGLSKTGTKSLARALRILGYRIYDFPEHMDLHLDEWIDICCGDGKLADFASMYADVDGVTDLPAAFWFEEILACFPEAKVILNVRGNADVWVQSWSKHLHMTRDLGFLSKLAYLFCSKPRKLLDYYNAEDTAVYGSVNPDSQYLFKKKYNEHNERVKAVVPASKLLVFNVKQGWAPLCNFLGVEVPSVGFPRENMCGSGGFGSIAVYGEELKHKAKSFILPLLLILLSVVTYSFYERLR